jgi:hypothetical protein
MWSERSKVSYVDLNGAYLEMAFRPGGKSSEALFGAICARIEGGYPKFEKSYYRMVVT